MKSKKKLWEFSFISPETSLSVIVLICSTLNFPVLTSRKQEDLWPHTFKGGFTGATQMLLPDLAGERMVEPGDSASFLVPDPSGLLSKVLLWGLLHIKSLSTNYAHFNYKSAFRLAFAWSTTRSYSDYSFDFSQWRRRAGIQVWSCPMAVLKWWEIFKSKRGFFYKLL